ncbi:hypothetical protein Poli38472_001515 [Pythium oligandrum]|uniref:RanBD1 domain-containing protein n=1 Tax=Pythium oligandrum TaxID=41045 RepID=A0A8K1FQF2_PYTOL|nr:hypothetical protein Poli38472_001515 [Pythium oligandrum]|eukprot:TMW69359.1 hypothetical protein Poli38472_001515 [Pythium oligandrum]
MFIAALGAELLARLGLRNCTDVAAATVRQRPLAASTEGTMSKRRNENGQMRREEYEAEEEYEDNGENGQDEGFQRASEDAIRKRKIVVARTGFGKKPAAAPVATSASPFQGFQGLTSTKPADEPVKTNPFAGFSGLTSTASAAASAKPLVPSFIGASTSVKAASSTVATADTYQEGIERLNKEFFDLVSEQIKKNPSSNWIDAAQDYIKQAETVGNKFASSKPVPARSFAPLAAPAAAPAASKPFSFAATPAPQPAVTEKKAAEPVSSGFSFGAKKDAPAAVEKPASSGFSFGTKTDAAPSSTTSSGFSFGASSASKPAELEKTTPGFSFGASATAKPAETDKPKSLFSFAKSAEPEKPTPAFSFGSAPATTGPASSSSGFSFNLSKPAATSTTAPALSSGGFSFNLPSSSAPAASKPFSFGGASSAAPATNGDGAAGEEEDEENIGREEATVILKSDNPDDDCVFDADKAKIFEFKKDEKRWADKGTHPLKVLVNKSTKNARILVRNEIGKIVLNSSLYKGLTTKVNETKGKKTGLILSLQIEDTMTQFLLKVSTDKVDAFKDAVEKNTPQ